MYDSIIIGCGPAGITAGIYLGRANKKVLILEKEGIGGAIASSPVVENYPGYMSISGAELTSNMFDQADNLGVELEMDNVTKIEDYKTYKKVITESTSYDTKTVIIATGSKYRTLGLSNEDNLIGNGIYFCVACDGPFFKDKIVAVIGGGNSATINALSLANTAKKVYLITNIDHLTSEESMQKDIVKHSNIEVIFNASLTGYVGDKELTGINYSQDNIIKSLNVDGIFLSIGLIPQNDLVKDLLPLNKSGYIISDDCKTNISGIYVAGDARTKEYRQVTVAVSDGTAAALDAIEYLNKN
jgi:thioredoxin reductase (NADPH)